ncbi:transposase [Nocardia sp. MW-W600-9]
MAATVGDRCRVLTDSQWKLELLPKSDGRIGRNFSNNRLAVEGMLHRLRAGLPWRDLPEVVGPWQTLGSVTAVTPRTEPGIGYWLR